MSAKAVSAKAPDPDRFMKKTFLERLGKDLKKHHFIYLMLLPVLIYYIIFSYAPMYGILIAFKDFSPRKGILGSDWVGFKYFEQFFSSVYFVRIFRNTLLISLFDFLWGFPAPIILALLLNEMRNKLFKRTVQTLTYLPYFISTVIVCGILIDFVSANGIINDIVAFFGGNRVNLLKLPEKFRTIYISSNIWQSVGWGSIIYLSALSGIDPTLYEAAVIDGAGRWKQLIHITLPGIAPTITILLILSIGSLLSVGAEKILLLYNKLIYETSDVIGTFVYRKGLLENNYSFSTAVGLFNSIINFTLLVTANKLSKKFTETSLW